VAINLFEDLKATFQTKRAESLTSILRELVPIFFVSIEPKTEIAANILCPIDRYGNSSLALFNFEQLQNHLVMFRSLQCILVHLLLQAGCPSSEIPLSDPNEWVRFMGEANDRFESSPGLPNKGNYIQE